MSQPSTPDFLNNVPGTTRELLAHIIDEFQRMLTTNLVGVYLHGSLAMGCFNPTTSDIDFIVVVNTPLSLEAKQKIVAFSLETAEKVSPNSLEFSVVLLAATRQFTHPTAYEVHYSRDWHERHLAGQADFEDQRF